MFWSRPKTVPSVTVSVDWRVDDPVDKQVIPHLLMGDEFLEGPVDLAELEVAARATKTTTLFVLTCTCGIAGCGGHVRGVRVTPNDDDILWHDLDFKKKWRVHREQLESAIADARAAGMEALRVNAGFEASPERNQAYLEGRDEDVQRLRYRGALDRH